MSQFEPGNSERPRSASEPGEDHQDALGQVRGGSPFGGRTGIGVADSPGLPAGESETGSAGAIASSPAIDTREIAANIRKQIEPES